MEAGRVLSTTWAFELTVRWNCTAATSKDRDVSPQRSMRKVDVDTASVLCALHEGSWGSCSDKVARSISEQKRSYRLADVACALVALANEASVRPCDKPGSAGLNAMSRPTLNRWNSVVAPFAIALANSLRSTTTSTVRSGTDSTTRRTVSSSISAFRSATSTDCIG